MRGAAQPYLGARALLEARRHDGRWGEPRHRGAAAQSLRDVPAQGRSDRELSGASREHQLIGTGARMSEHRSSGLLLQAVGSGRHPSGVAELPQGVIAASDQLTRDR